MLAIDRQYTMYHSHHAAGHAVVLSLLGFRQFVVDLDADETAESFTLAATPPLRHPVAARGVAIAAGAAAEVCYRRQRLAKRGGRTSAPLRDELAKLEDDAAEVDVDDLHAVADGKFDRHFLLLAAVAVRLLQQRWVDVATVAWELRRRRRLSSEEIAVFLRSRDAAAQTRTERYHSSSAAA